MNNRRRWCRESSSFSDVENGCVGKGCIPNYKDVSREIVEEEMIERNGDLNRELAQPKNRDCYLPLSSFGAEIGPTR